MKAAWRASLFSAGLARKIARGHAHDDAGYAIVFDEADTQRRACVFRPDEAMRRLREALGERFGLDDRRTRPKVTTLYAQALERAPFPELYAHVTHAGQPRGKRRHAVDETKNKKRRAGKKKRKPEKPAEGGTAARQTPQKKASRSKRWYTTFFF